MQAWWASLSALSAKPHFIEFGHVRRLPPRVTRGFSMPSRMSPRFTSQPVGECRQLAQEFSSILLAAAGEVPFCTRSFILHREYSR
jgi:hypothetical protein